MTTKDPQPRSPQPSAVAEAEAATLTGLTEPDHADPRAAETTAASETATETAADAVVARAAAGGYAMVGPSARTWSVDPATGIPVGPVSQAEHRLVRDLIAQERLDGTEPVWLPCADGGDEIVARLVPAPTDVDDPVAGTAPRTGDLSDAAHDGYAAGLGRTDIPGPLEPNAPAEHRDPAGLAARLAALGDRVADAADAGAPAGGWQTVSAARAADELVGQGYDPPTARALVGAYLRDTSERVGAPAGEWGLDQADLDVITTQARAIPAIDPDARATDARTAARGLPAAAVRVVAEQDAAAAGRAVQLGRWHAEDERTVNAEDTTADIDEGLIHGLVDGADEGCGDEAGWSR